MDRAIYLGMAGAKAAMQRQEVLANNLANAATPGFRAELQAFRAVPVRGDGASTRVFAIESTVGHATQPGPVQSTGRALDVALHGPAWLAVQGDDGTEAYTRHGALELDAEGQLVTVAGRPVQGEGGPITVPAGARVEIDANGTVTGTVGNGLPQVLGRLKLVTPEGRLARGEDGLFRAEAGDLPADPTARLVPAALEGSNVSAVETMVQMIAAARQFEHQMRLVKTMEQKEQAATRLLGPA